MNILPASIWRRGDLLLLYGKENDYAQNELQGQNDRDANIEFRLSCFVVKYLHPRQTSDAAAQGSDGEQGGLRDGPVAKYAHEKNHIDHPERAWLMWFFALELNYHEKLWNASSVYRS